MRAERFAQMSQPAMVDCGVWGSMKWNEQRRRMLPAVQPPASPLSQTVECFCYMKIYTRRFVVPCSCALSGHAACPELEVKMDGLVLKVCPNCFSPSCAKYRSQSFSCPPCHTTRRLMKTACSTLLTTVDCEGLAERPGGGIGARYGAAPKVPRASTSRDSAAAT